MGDTKSTTTSDRGFLNVVTGTNAFKTTITDGKRTETSRGSTPQEAEKNASEKWNKK